jgi:hypothetical protein
MGVTFSFLGSYTLLRMMRRLMQQKRSLRRMRAMLMKWPLKLRNWKLRRWVDLTKTLNFLNISEQPCVQCAVT